MPDFSHITKKAAVKADVEVEYKFDELEGAPSIWGVPAIEANKPFFNETLRRSAKRRNRRSKAVTSDTVAESRDEDKELLAEFSARRWNVKDANGADVEFSTENCVEFFHALPDHVFDAYRAWMTDPGNHTVEALGEDLGER